MNRTKKLGLGSVALAALVFAAAPCPSYAQQGQVPGAPPPAPDNSAGGFLQQAAGGWLGVGVEDVTPDKAKELKLAAAYGVYITEVGENSPASKAGIKKGDVITEYNGAQVQGAAEFRRIVRETPPGNTAQMSVWRDGRTEKLSAEIGHIPAPAQDGSTFFGRVPAPTPRGFSNRPEPPLLPGAMYGRRGIANAPTLGVSAIDLSGQLGEYFGAPGGEGVLVTDVHKGSAGEKAGLKAGDVITKINGGQVRNMGELRDKLAELKDAKSVTLGVLRKGTEMSITAAPEMPQAPQYGTPPPGGDGRIPL